MQIYNSNFYISPIRIKQGMRKRTKGSETEYGKEEEPGARSELAKIHTK